MVEELECSKQKWRGHRGVTTCYMKEVKSILLQETIEDDQIHRLGVLCTLLHEKQQTLKDLDEMILGICSTDDIEADITEADKISAEITETLSEREQHLQRIKTGVKEQTKTADSEGTIAAPPTSHMSHTDKLQNTRAREGHQCGEESKTKAT